MKYLQRIGVISLAMLFFVSGFVINASAQVRVGVSVGRGGVYRPVPRRVYRPYYNGFYGNRFGWGGGWNDPFWNDPYYTNPRLRELADRVHNENEVRDSRKKLRKYNEEFYADGYLTEKEQKKLEKAQKDYDKDLRRLQGDEE